MASTEKPVIVALSGPSSSGKTTIASSLNQLFKSSILVHLDDFYYPDNQIPFDKERNEYNWDCPEAINFTKFIKFMEKIKVEGISHLSKTKPDSLEGDINLKLSDCDLKTLTEKLANYQNLPIVFVEGFMLFHAKELASLFDIKLFFYAPYEVLKSRRENRNGYNTVDGIWVDPPGYFDKMVWPEYSKSHKYLFEDEDVNKNLNEYAINTLKIMPCRNDSNSTLCELINWCLDQLQLDKFLN